MALDVMVQVVPDDQVYLEQDHKMALVAQHLDRLEDMAIAVAQKVALEMDKSTPQNHMKALVDISVA